MVAAGKDAAMPRAPRRVRVLDPTASRIDQHPLRRVARLSPAGAKMTTDKANNRSISVGSRGELGVDRHCFTFVGELAKSATWSTMEDIGTPSREQFGHRIRELRQSAGLTAGRLGEATDLTPTAVSRIENGKRSIKSTELAGIASALGVSPLAILDPSSPSGQL